MERRFDMTNFEESLRDQVDQFSMVPSTKVWHGIYNDIHPGSKWPSIAMGFVFLFTLLGVGYLNNTPKDVNLNSPSEKNEPGINSEKQKTIFSSSQQKGIDKEQNHLADPSTSKNTDIQKRNHKVNGAPQILAKIIPLYPGQFDQKNKAGLPKNLNQINSSKSDKNLTVTDFATVPNALNHQAVEQSINSIDQKQSENNNSIVIKNNNELLFSIDRMMPVSQFEMYSKQPVQTIHLSKDFSADELEFINRSEAGKKDEIQSKKLHKKKNEKVKWVYFVTPSVSTATFIGKDFMLNSPNPSMVVTQPLQRGNNMIYNARLGYQIGTEMTYAFPKKWQFVTGLHLSYSGYNIISDQVHPTFATLMLKDENNGQLYSQSYITHYGNGQGQNLISLSNYSYQFSLPIGLQYALFENGKIEINLSSAIEPSIIAKSNAYIMSSDGRYYINDPNLLRKLNMSGNFGSFITFKSNKTKWQVGPSVRYQLLSTYQKRYSVKEHLIDYGIRIGISK